MPKYVNVLNTESIPAMVVGAVGFAIGETAVKHALKLNANRKKAQAKRNETTEEYVARKA